MKMTLKQKFKMQVWAVKYHFVKATIKRNLTWKFEAFVSINRKMTAFSSFSKIRKKHFIGWYFSISELSFTRFCVSATLERRQRSGKFRIWKVLQEKWPPFQCLTKFEKNPWCLYLEEISPAIFSETIIVQN